MSLLANIANVNFTTKYDVDKVIFKSSGSVSVTQAASPADFATVTIPHSLGYAPMVIGQYSETADFATAYEFGSPPYAYNGTFMQWLPTINGIAEANSTNILVKIQNLLSTRAVYYRIVAIIPSGVTSSPYMDLATRDDDLFNARDNFLKILVDGSETVSLSVTSPQTVTVFHGLGYRPMAMVFTKNDGVMKRSGAEQAIEVASASSVAYVDSANLYVEVSGSSASVEVFYRVYLDS